MHLKRLDIYGFKSFAERVTIDFDRGVNAIVGPNGSGKSNITDAIRWVLGEQSVKSLRGGKMEDIIFAGSETRKPLNFAEVSLILDNSDHFLPLDFDEVSVTRRVYRSGDSEFLINNQPCRLMDIINLFMDTGLGKEAFSIIGQGKIEEILNSRPEDRRAVFEEAAGVLTYKTRKKKAEVKLEETEDNLNRIRDIIHELESQLEPLREQASVAREYLEKKEELKTYEVGLFVYEIEQYHSRWEQLKAELESHRDREFALSASISKKEAELEQLKDRIARMDEEIERLQNELLKSSEQLTNLEGQKEVIKERLKNAGQHRQQIGRTIAELEEKKGRMEEEQEILGKNLADLEEALDKTRSALKEKQTLYRAYSEDISGKIEDLKGEYIDFLNEQAAAKNEEQFIREQLEQLDRKREQTVKERSRLGGEKEQLAAERREVQNRLIALRSEIHAESGRQKECRSQMETLEEEYRSREREYRNSLQRMDQLRSRIQLLKEMDEDYEGFQLGVKEILKAREQLPGIEGAVVELFSVDREYETAIATSLGAGLQYIVVQEEKDAREAIQYLKERALGRATFLPLSVIRPRELAAAEKMRLAGQAEWIGCAKDLIRYDPKYERVFSHLLGNVLIARTLKGANAISRLLQYRYRVVTLDGDVVNPGGSMTGGYQKGKSNPILNRKRELEELQARLKDAEAKTAALEEEVKAIVLRASEEKRKLSSIQERIDKTLEAKRKWADRLKELEWNTSLVTERLSLLEKEEKAFGEDREALLKKKKAVAEKIGNIERKLSELDEEISRLSKLKDAAMTEKEDLSEEISRLRIDLAKQEEQRNHLNKEIADLQTRYRELLDQLEENRALKSRLEAEIASCEEELIRLEKMSSEMVLEKDRIGQAISGNRGERFKGQQKMEDLERSLKEDRRQQKGLRDALLEMEVQLNKVDVEIENRLDRLREEYVLSYEGARAAYSLSVPYEEAKKKVKLIKMAIEEMGTVNLGAIEEFDRVSERHQFLTEQRKDLEAAKEDLFQVIAEMDEEMTRRFRDTFHAIREEFHGVFRTLFSGGTADLILTEPDDLLNTGVEIIAQPPGKKLQNLALLSGGERAFTAIALLFAILRVKPVPFCVLDEVEAALDEANVLRFSHYLKQYASETQFIVITHRKGTMEEADVLYGVTMQESGVSKMVSVRLEEAESVSG